MLHVTCCGSARCLRFRMCSCPRCVRRSLTTLGCSASTRWSRCRTWRRLWGTSLRRVGCLRAPLLPGQRPSSSQNSSSTSLLRAGSGSAGTATASLVGNPDSGVDSAKGTDPKTGFVPSGGEVKTDHKGTDPKTGFVPSGGESKNRPACSLGAARLKPTMVLSMHR